jgi:hypothetical protein
MIHEGPRVSDVLNRYGSYEPDFEPFMVPARQIISMRNMSRLKLYILFVHDL